MNKFKILAAIILICILGQSAALFYFVNRAQELAGKVIRSGPRYEELDKQFLKVSSEYSKAAKELEAVKTDRKNILAQTKSLLGEKAKTSELEEALQKTKIEVSSTEKELGRVMDQNFSLTEEINKLQAARARLTKERDELKSAYEKAVSKAGVKELKKENADLLKSLNSAAAGARAQEKKLEAQLQQAGRENSRLAQQQDKWHAAMDQLTGQLKDYKKNYAEAVKKNKALESKIRQTPAKFAEIARQNKVLLRQTAQMHYNLGVFYTKNKDYDRAVAEFEQDVAINPNDAFAHFNLGYIYAEYLVNRQRAMENFRHYLRLAHSDDPDVDWVKKYILTWETYGGKVPMQ